MDRKCSRLLCSVLFCLISTPMTALAFTKLEAEECVNLGISLFMTGGNIADLVDIAYMIENEHLPNQEDTVRQLLNHKALENQLRFKEVKANVVGQPQPKKPGFFLIAGNVWGKEKKGSTWQKFNYQYHIWARPTGSNCLIGRLAIQELFRLGGWVRNNM